MLISLDFILEYLSSSLSDGSDTTADILIHCNDGVVSTHRLVLASISEMLSSIFKHDTWDEPITIILPDFDSRELSSYLKDFCQNGSFLSKFSPISEILLSKQQLGFELKENALSQGTEFCRCKMNSDLLHTKSCHQVSGFFSGSYRNH